VGSAPQRQRPANERAVEKACEGLPRPCLIRKKENTTDSAAPPVFYEAGAAEPIQGRFGERPPQCRGR
jgi:hypothetical protein